MPVVLFLDLLLLVPLPQAFLFYFDLARQHPCTSTEYSLMSSGMSTFSVTNSQSKQSQQFDLISIALQTNFEQASQEKALITLATSPIF